MRRTAAPRPSYSQEEAAQAIARLLDGYAAPCALRFYDNRLNITNSYQVHSRRKRLEVCAILAATPPTARRAESLSAEWLVHNLAYDLHVRRRSARDVDLDYLTDRRWMVRAATRLFELLHLF